MENEKKLIADIARLFVPQYQVDNNISAWALISQHFIPLCEEPPQLPRTKGIGTYGPNGIGKSLHWQIIAEIANFFGNSFAIINAEKIPANFDFTKLSRLKKVYIDDLGYDEKRKDYGNTIDPIAGIINRLSQNMETETHPIAERYAETYNFSLYYSTNLDTDGYPTAAERYGPRIADRLKALATQVQLRKTESYRGITHSPKTPDPKLITAILHKYCIDTHNINPETDLLPHEKTAIEDQIQKLRDMYRAINEDNQIQNKRATDYQIFHAAMTYCDAWTKAEMPSKFEATKRKFAQIDSSFKVLWNTKYNNAKPITAQQVEDAKQKYASLIQKLEEDNEKKINFREWQKIKRKLNNNNTSPKTNP